MVLLKMDHLVIQVTCLGKCLSRGAVLRVFINTCAKLLEMLCGEGEMHRFVRKAAQQWGRCYPCFTVPEPKPGDQGPGTWWYFSFRRQPDKPSLVLGCSTGWAVQLWGMEWGKDCAKPLLQLCAGWLLLWVSIIWDFSCSISSLFPLKF